MIAFKKATTFFDFEVIEGLANTIWRAHYIAIIGKAQVDYMLHKFQSAKAIQQQTLEGYHYYTIHFETKAIGYFAIKQDDNNLFLSKLYLLKAKRGNGFGKQAMVYIETIAKSWNCNSISLTVNKENTNAIKTYNMLGFENLGALVMPIGNGFVMDDFKMLKHI